MPPPGGDVYSWGSGEMGQLGFPLLEDLPKDQDGYPYEPTAGLIKAFERTKICQIAGGDGHTAAVTVHGKLYSWGASACGQLGHSDTEHMPKDVEGYPYQPVPLLVDCLQDVCIVQIACGDAHTVALSREGTLYSWGGGGCGQLGHSETARMPKDEDGCPYQPTPRVVEHLRPHVVFTVACGKAHTIAVSDRGRMYTWGAGACGQLGHPDTSSFPSDEDGYPFQPVPREVEQLRDHRVISTACGDVHTLALSDIGHVHSFGGGSYGQLGIKDVSTMPVDADNCPYMPTPQRVSGLEGILRLACGDSHSLTVDRMGRLFCWGANSCGQLGLANPDDSRIRKDPDGIPHLPVPALLEVLADQRIVDIACGEAHSLAVSAMGNLYSWGACSCGQLGLGSCDGMPVDSDGYPYQPTPTLVTAGFQGKAVLRVACGGVHNLAITEPDQSLANCLAGLVNSDTLADACLRSSEGTVLHVHLCILKINAPRLHDFVQAQVEDKTAAMAVVGNGREIPAIDMCKVRMEVLLDFMHFVYTLDIDAAAMGLSGFAAVLELYHLASKFQLLLLLPKCRRIIRQQLGKQACPRPWLPSFERQAERALCSPRRQTFARHRDCPDSPLLAPPILAADGVPLPSPHKATSSEAACQWLDDPCPAAADVGPGWGIFFLPGGQALVLDSDTYKETLRRGTLLDLSDAELPAAVESSSVLEEHMRILLTDVQTTDVRLVVGRDAGTEREIPAHKCVLACRSAYFRALFSSEFRERGQARVPLEDITPEQLAHLLHFIYTDEWHADQEYAFDMIAIADRFSVLDLKRLCERTLICTMAVDNVARIFSLADRHACSRLRNRALHYMTDSQNFHAVMKTDGFAELDKTLILEILHSHKAAPAQAVPPLERLPGNSATNSKTGQSKSREHRHARGAGGGAGGSGTARPSSATATHATTAAAASTSTASQSHADLPSAPAIGGGATSSSSSSSTGGAASSAARGLQAPHKALPSHPEVEEESASGASSSAAVARGGQDGTSRDEEVPSSSTHTSVADGVPPAASLNHIHAPISGRQQQPVQPAQTLSASASTRTLPSSTWTIESDGPAT